MTSLSLSLLCASATADDNNDGLEVMLRPAFGSAGSSSPTVYAPTATAKLSSDPGQIFDGTASPYGAGFIGDAFVGYRFSRFVSAGLSIGTRTSSASTSNVTDGTQNLSRSAFEVGPYVRAYLPTLVGFEPWISAGAEYMHDAQSYDLALSGVPAHFSVTHFGVAVPLGLGVDYRFLDLFGVGPSFFYAPVIGAGGCLDVSTTVPGFAGSSFCTNSDSKLTKANGYGVWSVGLDLRVTVF